MANETLTVLRNSNTVETLFISTPFASSRCMRLELDLDGLKMLIYAIVRRTKANEWQLGSRLFRLYMIVLENWLSSLVEAYRPRGTRLAGCCIISAKLRWPFLPPDPRIDGAFPTFSEILLSRVVSALHKNVKPENEILMDWVHQEPAKPHRSCQRSVPTLRPRMRSFFFSGPKPTR